VISIHQLNADIGGEKGLSVHDDIAQYFCFPEFGYAVGLCPGDILPFNPQVYSCLSNKEPVYKDVNVHGHVTTFYQKNSSCWKE
jgi:hypothetical protein